MIEEEISRLADALVIEFPELDGDEAIQVARRIVDSLDEQGYEIAEKRAAVVMAPLLLRMAEAKARLIERGMAPRAFYLSAEDFRDFVHTRGTDMLDYVPVRHTIGKGKSCLYSQHGVRVFVPVRMAQYSRAERLDHLAYDCDCSAACLADCMAADCKVKRLAAAS